MPYLAAEDAKQQIVDLLHENFAEYDESAVEIDEKTGQVRLNFQESYFVRDSHELSQDMKDFLRIMIPKYAKSIYENEHASKLVAALKISGRHRPVLSRYSHNSGPKAFSELFYTQKPKNRMKVKIDLRHLSCSASQT